MRKKTEMQQQNVIFNANFIHLYTLTQHLMNIKKTNASKIFRRTYCIMHKNILYSSLLQLINVRIVLLNAFILYNYDDLSCYVSPTKPKSK